MASKLAYQIADEVIKTLFTNGAGEKASHIVLELEDGHNGGGWGERPARVHVAEVIEKYIARIGAVEQMRAADGAWDCLNCKKPNIAVAEKCWFCETPRR
jgi:hypothetical protein